MDLFGRFRKLDSSLQRGLDNGFARVFGGEVVPAEIDELLKQEAEDSLMEDRSGGYHAPSSYLVHVSARDHEALLADRPTLGEDLRDRLQRFLRNEGWSTSGPVTVDIVKDESLHTGQLKSRSWFDKETPGATPQNPQSRPAAQHWPEPGDGEPEPAPEWPRSGPDSGRNSAAQAYNADNADGQAQADRTPRATPGPATAAGAAGAAGGALAGLAHPHAESPRPRSTPAPAADSAPAADRADGAAGHTAAPRQEPPSVPGTEVFSDQHAQAPVAGADGAKGAAAGQPQRTVTLFLRDGSDRTYVLTPGSNLIGRGNAVDFRLPDTGVSRQHVDIAWDGYDAVLTDLKSTNGTTVNETPVENWLLADGDVIVIGHSEIEVRIS